MRPGGVRNGMRVEDRRALSEPFPVGRKAEVESEIATRLRVPCPKVLRLEDEVLDDLADGPPYGIEWWRESAEGDRARRILLADHLCACLRTLVHHLLAARLAWSDFVEARQEENAVFGRIASVTDDGKVQLSRPDSPAESRDLAEAKARLREDGVALSLHSALDCLAAIVAIVASLPVDARRASFPAVRKKLREIASTPGQARELREMQGMLSKHIEDTIGGSESVDWIEWLYSYRNLIVHRGRLRSHVDVRPSGGIVRPDGRPARWKFLACLPKYPELSDVENFLVSSKLGENLWSGDSEAILRRLIERIPGFVEETAGVLLEVWERRRACPEAAFLAPEQWRPSAEVRVRGGGSAAKSGPTTVSTIPLIRKLWRAAAMTAEQRQVWEETDMQPFVPTLAPCGK